MRILEASVFKKAPSELREILMKSGVLPVNDIFLPIWESTKLINLLYGSYGSGKSVAIVDRLIDKSLNNKYFRCYFGRKILNDVRGSVFKTIIDRIRERNLKHRFLFSEAPTGSMTIICKENGNEFIPFGANDTESLKSIKDPTDFFCEELNQFTFEDFRFILSRLRKEEVSLQLWGAFNTDKVYQSHWIRTNLFSDKNEFEPLIYRLKANYTDNWFINQETYLMTLRLAAGGNMGIFNAIAKGEWGMVRTGDEFWKQFDESRHVKPVKIEATTLHVSVDNNVTPYVTQTVWQVFPEKKEIRQVWEVICRKPDNNAPKAAKAMAKWIKSINYIDTLFVYGDPSANARSTIDENNASFFDKYIGQLREEGINVTKRVQKAAPQISLSADFINDIYESSYAGWTITISDNCFESIEDYILVKEDADGTMKKPKVTDKETQVRYEPQGHISDTKRYIITTILKAEFEQYKSRNRKRSGSVDVPG